MHCHRFVMFLTQFNRFLLPQRIQKCSGLFRDIESDNCTNQHDVTKYTAVYGEFALRSFLFIQKFGHTKR